MAYTPANTGFISTLNSTSTNLTSGQIFTGTSEDLTNYSIIEVAVYSSHASATNGLSLQQSSDNSNWDIIDTYTIPAATGKVFSLSTSTRYFRLVYTNGSVGTTSLRIQTSYHSSWGKSASVRPEDNRSNENDMEEQLSYQMVYNKITSGWDRVRGDSSYGLDVNVTRFDPGTSDTFGNLKVAQFSNIVNVGFYKTGLTTSLITVTTGSTGSFTQPTGYGVFSTGTGTTASSKSVTNQTVQYTPGSEVSAMFTTTFTTPTDNLGYQRIGLYDTNNGFFIGYSGTTFVAASRNGASDTYYAKSAWNIDPLTGGTSSKFTRLGVPEAIDLTKLNVYRIRFGWLGAASIFFEVLSPDDMWVIFHQILQPNLSTTPSILNPDLPITLDVSKTSANSTSLVMNTGCWGIGVSYIPDVYPYTNSLSVSMKFRNPTYRLLVYKQAAGADKVYFDLFNASGSGKVIRITSIIPMVSGAVAVTGTLGVDLYLTKTTAVGTGGTTVPFESAVYTASTITRLNSQNPILPSQITARSAPTGGATAGAAISWCSLFTEETNSSTYLGQFNDLVRRNQIDIQPLALNQGEGIRVIQGPIASVGNIGFDVIFELDY